MNEFAGNKLKVRCVDCTHLSGTRCVPKKVKVSPRKRRMCRSYQFTGAYDNRTPAESMYIPHVDQKTRQMIRKLLKLGITPVSEADLMQEAGREFQKVKTLQMPASTATAGIITEQPAEDDAVFEQQDKIIDPEHLDGVKLIWTPDDVD